MNAVLILSGGIGKRFGAPIPKQYVDLCGKPVIDYAIENALKSESIDEIVIAMDQSFVNVIKGLITDKVHIVPGGEKRVDSIINGLEYLKRNYSDCEKVVITQAVSPFVTSDIIDKYTGLLDEYDVVTTASKCPGELFNTKEYKRILRDDYYFCQSPEAFRFNDLCKYIDKESAYSEIIYHYPFEPKIYYNLDFYDNIKLTFSSDLDYAEFLMKKRHLYGDFVKG